MFRITFLHKMFSQLCVWLKDFTKIVRLLLFVVGVDGSILVLASPHMCLCIGHRSSEASYEQGKSKLNSVWFVVQ